MGRLATPLRPFALAALGCAALVLGCASGSAPESRPAQGFVVHTVRAGENLYRIGLRYGVPADSIRRANGIRDVRDLKVGQRLRIPAPRGKTAPASQRAALQRDVREAARREAQLDFDWPVRGALTSRFGRRRGGPHEGIDLGAPQGTPVRAAEAGKVIYAGRYGDYGRMLIVKHAGHYSTVYAHAHRLLVRKGAFVERGQAIAEVGRTGNASGPHLHFEVRRQQTPRDPLLYLP